MISLRSVSLGIGFAGGLALFAAWPGAAATGPVVTLDSGAIAGEPAAGISIFRSIPYAAPPVGALRWRSPQRAAKWTGVRQAMRFGAACPQAGAPGVADITRYGGAPEPTGEDCLTLNVWAPARTPKPAPVMVWFHGGSGRMGAGSLPYYDGSAFARDGVMLVTVNYRLGHLGGFDHPALTSAAQGGGPTGNYALMDQVAALQWVRRNIAAFGGDPGNVTIFGESSGGISVFNLTVTPSARGLFHKAIIESAGGWFPPAPSLKASEEAGEKVAAAAGAPAHATAAQLRALPARAIAKQPAGATAAADRRLSPEGPTSAIDAGRQASVPLMIGVNSGEDSLLDSAGGLAKAKAAAKPADIAKVRALYGPGTDDELAVRYMLRDGVGTAPARWVARKWSARAPAYLYRFDHVDEAARGRQARAAHGSE
ncbi:MAG: carboxylesterase/lipase family protein, partial [Phenylobacterium sp.]|nr:carboxylesterase/lipase family protein [Phenylobacterium sp.]